MITNFDNVGGLNFDKIVDSLIVSRFITLYILLAIIVYHDLKVYQADIVVAFLNRDLEKKIYIEVLDSMRKFVPSGLSRRY